MSERPPSGAYVPLPAGADLLQAASEQPTFVMDLPWGEGTVRMHVRDGALVELEGQGLAPDAARLIVFAVGLGQRSARALTRRAAAKGRGVDERAVEERLVSVEQGRRLREVVLREQALSVLLRANDARIVEGVEPASQRLGAAVPITSLTREIARRARYHDTVYQRVPTDDAVYARKPTALADLDRLGPDVAPEDRPSTAERIAIAGLDGRRPVHELSLVTALGDFETRRALSWLVERGYATQVKDHGVPTGRPLRRRSSRLAVPLSAFASVLGLAIVLWIGLRAPPSPAASEPPAQMATRARYALRAYGLTTGRYPDALGVLSPAAWLNLDEFVLRARLQYSVTPQGDAFRVAPAAATRVERPRTGEPTLPGRPMRNEP